DTDNNLFLKSNYRLTMAKKEEHTKFNARHYMEMAIQVMNKSIQEPRQDKISPKVGAVLIKTDGTEETAFSACSKIISDFRMVKSCSSIPVKHHDLLC
ncbi:MAG: hypothetical protein ACREHG_03520, partial [Candidatus Saccharimonadales bacterium]